MKSNRKLFSFLLAAMGLVSDVAHADDKPATNAPTAAAPAASKLDQLFPDPVVAKGTGFEIKRSQLDEAISSLRANAKSRGQEVSAEDAPLVEHTAFDHLLEVQVLKAKATPDDKTKAAAETDKRIDLIKKRAPSPEALELQLKTMNLTLDGLRDRLLEEAEAEQVLRDKVTVTDAQVQKFYDENPAQFEEPEMVRASHILIATANIKTGAQLSEDDKKAKLKIAQDLLKRARAGEDFAKLAKEYSDDPGSKENGGEYIFPRGRMVKEFEAAAFTLQTNQISDIVTTQFGYHIIKLSEKIPAKKVDFAKASPDIKIYLESKEMAKILPGMIEGLKKDANLQILDEQLKTLEAAAEKAAAEKAAADKDSMPPAIAAPK
jgi:peptidyl-prolyl cis-trans isomerase C